MAVRGLSQAVSDSQGWSLHKAILLRSVFKLMKLGRLEKYLLQTILEQLEYLFFDAELFLQDKQVHTHLQVY